ncbi:MAG: 50S ribosomal protein L10 [Candidatus Pacearchaeota archaeon]
MKRNKPIPESKKKEVKEIANLVKKRSILVCSTKNLKAAQLQQIRKKIREKAVLKVAKKKLIKIAIEETKDENLKKVLEYINADYVLIFSDGEAFEIISLLADNKTPAKARAGQEAIEDIWVKAGPTNLAPGPDISLLSSVGLQPKVEGGKIAIAKDTLFVKKGEKISQEKATILAKLDITPFEIGLEPIVAFSDGKIYTSVKLDKKETLKNLNEEYSRGLAFAVSICWISKDSLPFILSKAALHESVLKKLVDAQTKSGEKQ